MPIGHHIRLRREHLEMTQVDLANAALVSPGVISHYETGTREPSIPALERLAMALRGRVGDLFDDAKEPPMVLCPHCSGSGCLPKPVSDRIQEDARELVRLRIRSNRQDTSSGARIRPSPSLPTIAGT